MALLPSSDHYGERDDFVCDLHHDALFLDFDGTLVDLAPQPEGVLVPPGLVSILQRVHEAANGAVAIISGRPLQQIDHFLFPLQLPVAGVHGIERRSADGHLTILPAPEVQPLRDYLKPLLDGHPGLLLEEKRGALALHYRHAPHMEQICLESMAAALAHIPGFTLLRGKMVVEAKGAQADKGDAIAAFMRELPFVGRRPLFVGDDVTDEAGFSWVQSEQGRGQGIKVGEGVSLARVRIKNPEALREMLEQLLA